MLTPEQEALLAQIMGSGGLGQLQAPVPSAAPLGPEPGLLPPGQMMPARMPLPEQGALYPPAMEGVNVKMASPASPQPYGGPELPPLARGNTGYTPPAVSAPFPAIGAPQTAIATNDAPMPPMPSGASPAQPAGVVPAMKGLFADKDELRARIEDMFMGWAAGAGGTWQDSIAAGGKMMAAGKLTRKEKKELAASDNKTREWAIANGVDPATADAYVTAGQGKALIGLVEDYKQRAASAGQRDPVVVGTKIVDKNTGDVIGDYSDAESGPDQFEMVPLDEVKTLGLDPSRPYQRNTKTGKIDPVGSSGQTIQVGSKLTETQSKDIGFINRGAAAVDNLKDRFAVLAQPKDAYISQLPGGNFVVSPEYQQAQQAGRELLAVILRKDTGAAITAEEMATYGRTYLPQPGDSDETIRQKWTQAKGAIDSMYKGLGTIGSEYIPDYKIGPIELPGAAGAPVGGPAVGTIDGGYRFKGGNPADQNNWEPVR